MTGAAVCTVYLARLSLLRPWHRQLLDASEEARAGRFRLAADRDRFVLATALLRTAVARSTSGEPARVRVDRSCERCGGEHGRPRLPGTGLDASITHSGDVVAVALTAAGPVGVDVEAIGRRDYEPLLSRVCTDAEAPRVHTARDFYTVWTRKEAVLKATGAGLRTPMRSMTVTPPAEPAAVLTRPAGVPACWLADVDAGERYAAAVAMLTDAAVSLEVRDAGPLLAG